MNNTVTRQVLGKIMITSKGEYNSLKSYEILDAVTYQGSSYLSKKYNNDSLPTNTNDWQLLAQKGDTYELSEEDLQRIAEQITSNANSAFNQNAKEKTDSFNSNATEKLDTYNSNHTAKLKEYNDNATSKLSAYNANTVTKTTEYNSNHTSKINAYDTNASDKVDAYNTNADTRLEEYNTNANTKINEYDEHSKELNNKIVSTRNELERLKSNVLNTGEDTDTFIHLEDSAMAELQEIKVDGVLQQNTTTGKNLFDENNTTHNLIIENGNITTNSSWNMSNYIEVSGNTDYVVKHNDTTSTTQAFVLAEYDADKKIVKRNVQGVRNTNIPYTITTTDTTRYLIFNYNNTYNNTMLQLEKGSTPTDYEPYTGGQPSPNPDFPQEIKTITGNLKITSCGRNLLKNTATSATVNGVSFTVNDDGSVLANGTATDNATLRIVPIATTFSQNLILSPNKTYTLSDSVGNYTDYFTQVVIQDANGNKNWYNTKGDIDISTNVIASLYAVNIYIRKDVTVNNILFKPQLVVKDSTTLFESYVESQIQAKLPENEFIGKFDDTYKDTVRAEYFPEEGQYHLMLDKMIGHKNFNNETKILYSELQGDYFLFQITIGYLPSAVMISNNFINKSNYGLNYNYESIYRGSADNNAFQFKVKKERVASYDAAGALSFIKNSNTEAYYALATPYTLDLGVIDMPMSYKDITNIFTDSDLLPKINAKYYRVFDKTIQNAQINEKTLKQEITDLNATVSALDTRLKALETKTVEEPTESEGTV